MEVTLYNYSKETGLRVDTKVDEYSKIGHRAVFNQEFLEQALFFNEEGENHFLRVVDFLDRDEFVIELGIKARVEADMVSTIRGEEYPAVDYLKSVLLICKEYKINKEESALEAYNSFVIEINEGRKQLKFNLANIEGQSGGRKEVRG